mgnify:FL=1
MGKRVRKYKKGKDVKPVTLDEGGYAPCQYDVIKSIKDDKKIRPQDVFEGFKSKSKSAKSKVIKNDTRKGK